MRRRGSGMFSNINDDEPGTAGNSRPAERLTLYEKSNTVFAGHV